MKDKKDVAKMAARSAAVGVATSVGADAVDRVTESLSEFDPISEIESFATAANDGMHSAASIVVSRFTLKRAILGIVVIAAIAAAVGYFTSSRDEE